MLYEVLAPYGSIKLFLFLFFGKSKMKHLPYLLHLTLHAVFPKYVFFAAQ